MYMHELRDRRQKHYPPEFIDEKRTIGGGATVCDNHTAKLITEVLRLLTATGLATVMTAAQSRTAKWPEALAAGDTAVPTAAAGSNGLLDLQAAETAALWQPAPRRTAADEADDRRSTDRRLDERLLLLLKSPGQSSHRAHALWYPPHVCVCVLPAMTCHSICISTNLPPALLGDHLP